MVDLFPDWQLGPAYVPLIEPDFAAAARASKRRRSLLQKWRTRKMPVYEYFCPANEQTIEVEHSMRTSLTTWSEVCAAAGLEPGPTAADAPVQRLIFPATVSSPVGNSHLKNLGFTKLVRRDSGVYENVTATNTEKRYMVNGDPSSMPDIKRKISD